MKKLIIAFLVFGLIPICAKTQTTVTITNCVDARVDSDQPNANFGTHTELSVYSKNQSGTKNSRAYIQFTLDQTQIPANANIISAKLYLYRNGNPEFAQPYSHAGNNNLYIRRVIEPWSQSSIDWNNKKNTTTTNQASIPKSSSPFQHLEADVTDIIRDIYESGNNFGMSLQLQDETPEKSWSFCASEHPNSALRPKLVVTYVANRQIILNEDMITPLCVCIGNGSNSFKKLADEQSNINNMNKESYTLPYSYSIGQTNQLTNAQFIIDLKDSFILENIDFYDTEDEDTIFYYTGNPVNWKYKGYIYTNIFQNWNVVSLNDTSRYILIEFRARQSQISEIVVKGRLYKKNNEEVIVKNITTEPVKMKTLLGVNGGLWTQDSLLEASDVVRTYQTWSQNEGSGDYQTALQYKLTNAYPNNQYAFNPDYNGVHQDDVLSNWHSIGIEANPCLQQTAIWLSGNADPEIKPIDSVFSTDPLNPNSYKAHADFLYQFTARYGRKVHPKNTLKLKSGQVDTSGLGYINYVENWNEPDKWYYWDIPSRRAATFMPFELAAMSSMDYDGHERSDTTVGVKNADSTMKMVMGGLASINLDYIKAMKLWAEHFRTDKKFPADVINLHHYSIRSKLENIWADSIGLSPEEDGLKNRLKEIVDYRNKHLPGVEIWLSEFGYDVNDTSVLKAPSIGPYNNNEIQGRWMLRSFLEIAASGIDRSHWFQINDPNPQHYASIKFNTCGLVRDTVHEKTVGGITFNVQYPIEYKPSWYYMKGMKETLKGTRFSKELASGNPNINLYEFKTDNNDTIIYAVWCNTSNNTVINNYKLGIGKEQCKVEYILPYANHSLWHTSNLTVAADSAIIDSITELVTFIRVIKPRVTTNLLATVNHTGLYTENKICKGDSVYHLYLNQNSPICRYWIEVFRTDTNIAYSGNYGKQSNSIYKLYDSTTALPQQFSFPGFYFEAGAVYKIIFRAKNCNDTCIIQVNEFEISVPFKVSIEAVKVNVSEQLLANSLGAVVKLKGIMKGFNALTDSFEWWPPSGLSYPNNLRDSLNQIANYIEGVDSITYFLYGKSITDCYDTAQFTLKHNKLAFVNNTNDTLCLNNNNLIMGNRIEESLIFGVLYYLSGGPGQQFHQNLNSNTWQYIYGAQNYQGLSGFLLSESAKNLMSSKPALQIFLENRDNWFEFYNRSWYANYINEFYFGDRDVALNNFYSEINNDGTLTNYLNPNNLNNYQWDDSHINDIHELLLLFLDNKTSTWVPYDQYTYILVETIPFESSWEYANFELDETQNNLTWFNLPNANATNWNNHFIVNHSPIKNTKYRFTVIDNINSFIEYDIKSVFIDTTTVIPYFQPYVQTDTSTIYFVNLSEPYNVTTHFEWNFGDGSDASTEPDPLHTFPKSDSTYWVCMTLFNKCITNGLQWCDSIRVSNNQNGLLSPLPPDKPLHFNTKLNQDELRAISKNGLTQELEQKINKNKKVVHKGISLTAMPNPFSQYTTIHYQIDELNGKAAIELTNSIGTTVYKDEITTAEGSKVIYNNGLAKGIYHCRIFNQNHSKAIKLVIE